MSDKQIEALKRALEAMNLARAAHGQMLLSDPPQEAWKAWGVSAALTKAMTAASEALADSALERMAENERELGLDYMEPAPPPECKTDAEKTAFAFGWWKALEENRKQPAHQEAAYQYLLKQNRQMTAELAKFRAVSAQALEALAASDDFLFNYHDCEPNNEREVDAYSEVRGNNMKAWEAIREALAEQPAQDDPDLQDKDPELVEQHYKQVVDGVRKAFDAKRKQQPAQKGCMRCNTPKKCALYGCSPLTWPAEQPAQQGENK